DRRAGDGDRFARLGLAGHRGTRRRRQHRCAPHLSHRSRLRMHRGENGPARRAYSPPARRQPAVGAAPGAGMITLALSKGRILQETLPLLAAAGIEPEEDPAQSRRLVFATSRDDLRLLVIRATDVPTFVAYGAADLGVAGKDVLLEHGGEDLYEPLDLGIARC